MDQEPHSVRVAIDRLRRSDSPRLYGEDARHVEVLTQADTPLPPILVHRTTMRVIDGMHRLCAARQQGRTTIEVRFFDGDEETSFIEAVRANQEHGLPLTLADRQAAAKRIIRSRPHLSDRAIADITGLAPRTVAAIRGQVDPEGGRGVRFGRDGRMRPLNSAVGRRIASEALAVKPDTPLREIARVAGISLGTAHDVRERMRHGEDPVPPKLQRREERPAGSAGGGPSGRAPGGPGDDVRRSPDVLLRNLSNDPSLRFSEAGRATLRWLFARINRLDGWEEVADGLPSHCAYVVAEVARSHGQQWLAFAAAVKQRVEAEK